MKRIGVVVTGWTALALMAFVTLARPEDRIREVPMSLKGNPVLTQVKSNIPTKRDQKAISKCLYLTSHFDGDDAFSPNSKKHKRDRDKLQKLLISFNQLNTSDLREAVSKMKPNSKYEFDWNFEPICYVVNRYVFKIVKSKEF
ncbi:MAG: hypothetical protein ABJA67_17350 [Chthonomonadales bacterium]